jgi:hypothetical protein
VTRGPIFPKDFQRGPRAKPRGRITYAWSDQPIDRPSQSHKPRGPRVRLARPHVYARACARAYFLARGARVRVVRLGGAIGESWFDQRCGDGHQPFPMIQQHFIALARRRQQQRIPHSSSEVSERVRRMRDEVMDGRPENGTHSDGTGRRSCPTSGSPVRKSRPRGNLALGLASCARSKLA